MSQLDEIRSEAERILRIVGPLRLAEDKASKDRGGPAIKFVPAAKLMAEPMMHPGEPTATARPSEAFEDGLHFWALRVAPFITFIEWEAMVENARALVPDFNGDALRFFENRFEGMTLKCGAMIWP